MAKDPRFNFYVDNWIGGTEGFTLEQEGAYLALIILQSKKGRFTEVQAIDKLLQKTRGNAAASAGLWEFLMPKFETDGYLFWSARLEKEVQKSKKHSEKQSERASQRWNNQKNAAAYTARMPDNSIGISNGNGNEEKGVQGEKERVEEFLATAFDDMMLESIKSTFPKHNVENELKIFQLKVRGSPTEYSNHQVGGIRKAFIHQLKTSTATNGTRNGNKTGIRPTVTTDSSKSFGSWE